MKVKSEEIDEETIKEKTKEAQKDMFMSYMPYLIIIFFVIIIRTFITTPIKVRGTSMEPTLKGNDYMLLYKLTKRTRGIKRFDIVVVNTDSGRLIKRVIGLPGDKIIYKIEEGKDEEKKGVLYINGKKVEEEFLSDEAKVATCKIEWPICKEEFIVPDDEYYVMGDNRGNSADSRKIGSVRYDDIAGTTKLVFFPFSRFGNVD